MAPNFASSTPTINAGLVAEAQNGALHRSFGRRGSSSTAALATCGSVSCYRMPGTVPIPSPGSGVAGFVFPTMNTWTEDPCIMLAGIEYELGSLTVSTNTFSAGSSMPTETIRGVSVQTAAAFCFAVCTVAVTATTPTLTITYTDQDGNTGNSCAPVLPTSPLIDTAFFLQPHLANGDTAMRAVTNMSISTGSAGTIRVFGLLPLTISHNTSSQMFASDMLGFFGPDYISTTSDKIAVYRVTSATASDFIGMYTGLPDPT